MNAALIYAGVRSPRGRARPDGALAGVSPHELLRQLYRGLCERTSLQPVDVGEVILGCVTQQGEQAANIARTSLLYAGWPTTVPGMTVHRFCSSSIDAVALAAMKIQVGVMGSAVAGGVEMMSRVPMLSDGAKVFADAEFAQRCRSPLMGSGADLIASLQDVSREQADALALQSQQLAAAAQQAGYFDASILPVQTPGGIADRDECIRGQTTAESLAALPPAFAELGASGVDAFLLKEYPQLATIRHIHTAGNSPAMADAAALLLLGNDALGASLQVAPRARVAHSVTAGEDSLQVLSGCIRATELLLEKTGLTTSDVDLFEIHEAFAATSVVARRRLGLGDDNYNVNGGCIALGHPMGATGAIMTITLLDELERRGLRRGIVAAAGAAGSGSALLIDRDLG